MDSTMSNIKVINAVDYSTHSVHIIEKKPKWMTKIMAETQPREVYLKVALRETLMYMVLIILITIIAIGMVYPSMFYVSKVLKDQFVYKLFLSKHGALIDFKDIKNTADFWRYLETAMSDAMFWEYWYQDPNLLETDPDSRKILYENKLIGVPRLRQLKVRNDSCEVNEFFQKSITACYDSYSWENRDTNNFGLGTHPAWQYHTPQQTGSYPFEGKLHVKYDGGGYYQELSLTKARTKEIIEELRKNLWVTRGTRVVILDFVTYNANVNLFCAVKLLFEFPPTGGIITSSRFFTLKLLRYVFATDFFVLSCEILFFIHIVYYTMQEIWEFIYLRSIYFKHFWNLMDCAILVLSYIYLAISIVRFTFVRQKLANLPQYLDSYPNFEFIASLQIHQNNLIAVLLFFSYMKIFEYITFNKTMAQLNNTIKNCIWDVLGFGVMFFIIFVAYAQLGYLLFGYQVEEFSSFGKSTFTLLRTILGDFDYMKIDEVDRVIAPIFYMSFIFFVFFILLNMFLAIITDTYGQVKTELAMAPSEMQMIEYILQSYYNFMRKIGLGRCINPKRKQIVELNVTIEEIRGALKRCEFTDLEIEMFFCRFNIDPLAKVGPYNVDELLSEMDEKPLDKIERKQEKLYEPVRRTDLDGMPMVTVEEFTEQRNTVYEIEEKLAQVILKLDLLLDQFDKMDATKQTKQKL